MCDGIEWRGDSCAMATDVLKPDSEHTCVRSLNSVARSVLVSLGVSQPPAEFSRRNQIDDSFVTKQNSHLTYHGLRSSMYTHRIQKISRGSCLGNRIICIPTYDAITLDFYRNDARSRRTGQNDPQPRGLQEPEQLSPKTETQ
jgi:hypothetical protein